MSPFCCLTKTTKSMFLECSNLTSITGMEKLITADVTSMEKMFSVCSSLTAVDLTSLNTSNVTSMERTFYKAGYNADRTSIRSLK